MNQQFERWYLVASACCVLCFVSACSMAGMLGLRACRARTPCSMSVRCCHSNCACLPGAHPKSAWRVGSNSTGLFQCQCCEEQQCCMCSAGSLTRFWSECGCKCGCLGSNDRQGWQLRFTASGHVRQRTLSLPAWHSCCCTSRGRV